MANLLQRADIITGYKAFICKAGMLALDFLIIAAPTVLLLIFANLGLKKKMTQDAKLIYETSNRL